MDSQKAKNLEKKLKHKKIASYKIVDLIDNGKSAAVFKAVVDTGGIYAIKIFDEEIIERYGHEIQTERINQEIGLKGHDIPNLVKIYDGGITKIGKKEYYFIVMEFLHGKNLKKFIETENYSEQFIQDTLRVLFHVSQALLEKGIAHRDIKPENIMVGDGGQLTLMDMGVLKLIGAKSFSDVSDEKQFLGTLRYAPPEFLMRKEKNTKEGWKAVNLYQIGAVLHDLIMKCELFHNATPYPNLVIAITDDAPEISNSKLSLETIQITRDLLTKDSVKRLARCPDSRINDFTVQDLKRVTTLDKSLGDLIQVKLNNKAKIEQIENIKRDYEEKQRIRQNISLSIETTLLKCFGILKSKMIIKDYKHYKNVNVENVNPKAREDEIVKNNLYIIEGEFEQGFSRPLFIIIRFLNNESSDVRINLLGMFPDRWYRPSDRFDAENFFMLLNMDRALENLNRLSQKKPIVDEFVTYEAFNGVAGFDSQFEEKITLELLKLIRASLSAVKDEVDEELEIRKRVALGKKEDIRKSRSMKYINKIV